MSWYTPLLVSQFETGWAIGLEYSDDLSKRVPTLATVLSLVFGVVLQAEAVKDLLFGTAYALRTGIGAVGTASLAPSSSTNR